MDLGIRPSGPCALFIERKKKERDGRSNRRIIKARGRPPDIYITLTETEKHQDAAVNTIDSSCRGQYPSSVCPHQVEIEKRSLSLSLHIYSGINRQVRSSLKALDVTNLH